MKRRWLMLTRKDLELLLTDGALEIDVSELDRLMIRMGKGERPDLPPGLLPSDESPAEPEE